MIQKDKKIGIIGAGLSGLACAIELKENGFEVEMFESAPFVGGRVHTEVHEGFLLDKGFQVYLPSYEMGKYFFDHEALRLKGFSAGALIYNKGKFECLSDPLRDPSSFLSTISNQLGSFKDKVLILKLKISAASASLNPKSDESTQSFLKKFGFSNKFISTFFNPFFSGIFLEKDLGTSKSFFLYLFDKFASAEASLPSGGMGQLTKQLAEKVGKDAIFLNTKALEVSQNSISLKPGVVKNYDAVVLATSAAATNTLLGSEFDSGFHATQTYYYKTKSHKYAKKKLFLNSSSDRAVNHVACMSAVNTSYAPEGWHLFSVSTVGSVDHSLGVVESDLKKLFGEEEINTWQHLKTHKITQALPAKPLYSSTVLEKDGVFICGDFTASPSIQGALSSGYQVAQEISKLF